VRGLEPILGLRVVADPAALDIATWTWAAVPAAGHPGAEITLRIAPDEAFAIGAEAVSVDDPHAIVERESGLVATWLTPAELLGTVARHLEWPLPTERPVLAQGLVAGVPAKLWLSADGAILITAAAYADELGGRLR
jgi:hypothetical protein